VLDGGFKKWISEKKPVESLAAPGAGNKVGYDYNLNPNLTRSYDQIKALVNTQEPSE
jgi:3-mercaptopyruvate sulfurtransferase SseA